MSETKQKVLVDRDAVLAIIENRRLRYGKHDLSVEYTCADITEKVEALPALSVVPAECVAQA